MSWCGSGITCTIKIAQNSINRKDKLVCTGIAGSTALHVKEGW